MIKYKTFFLIIFLSFSCSEKKTDNNYSGMVLIEGSTFLMGSNDSEGHPDESPVHEVKVNSFWMDETEVTNSQFKEFIDATGYITTAEIKPDWNELKKDLPPNTPIPDESLLVPASLVFKKNDNITSLNNHTQWWAWVKGANWRNPGGEGTSIDGKDDHPVIHVSWFDAMAYAEWKGRRLPTEAEWEFASRGGLKNNKYSWGNDPNLSLYANTWEGVFPKNNIKIDGFESTSPVKSYPPNKYGLYDMSGNVWEWCSDLYNYTYYNTLINIISDNPKGPEISFDPNEPYSEKRVVRGGSYLCSKSYCTGYRNSMRMKSTPDTGSMHTGFRTVKDTEI